MGFLTSLFSGWQGYLIGGALLVIASASGGAYVDHRIMESTVANMKLADSQATIKAINIADASARAQDKISLDAAIAEQQAQDALNVKTVTLTKEVTKYVTAKQDATVCVPFGLIRVLDAAALQADPSTLSLAPGESDDGCSPVKASALAENVIGNYETGLQNAEQLNALESSVIALHNAQTNASSPNAQ